MILYEKEKNMINVYDLEYDKLGLIEFKKKYLADIKTIIINTHSPITKKSLYEGQIMFRALDREDESYIKVTNNNEMINNYIMGKYDSIKPTYVIGDDGSEMSSYNDLYNENYTLLFTGGHYFNKTFITDENILISGEMAELQPILSGDLSSLKWLDKYCYNEEFFKLLKYKTIKKLNYDNIMFGIEQGLFELDYTFEDKLKRSSLVLSLIRQK